MTGAAPKNAVGRPLALESFAAEGEVNAVAAYAARRRAIIEAEIRDAAYADGMADAEAAARATAEAELAEARAEVAAERRSARAERAALAAALRAVEAAETAARDAAAAALGAWAAAATRKLTPILARRGFEAELRAAVEDWARGAGRSTGVLSLNPADRAEFGDALTQALAAEGVETRLTADPKLARGAARFDWTEGFGEIDLPAASEALAALLEPDRRGAEAGAGAPERFPLGDEDNPEGGAL